MELRRSKFLLTVAILLHVDVGALAQDATSPSDPYYVLPGDILRISVWKEPDLQLDVLVRPDSAFSFPLAGDVSTNGLTVADLQAVLTERLTRYISNPEVTVSVSQVLGHKIYVIGQVKTAGQFVVNPRVDVMQALSMAGGVTAFAATNEIQVLRRTGSEQIAIPFKYSDVLKGRDLDQNIVLRSGDIVVVP